MKDKRQKDDALLVIFMFVRKIKLNFFFELMA